MFVPAEHLRRLIERAAPDRSLRQLTAAAGVPENKLGYWVKPGTTLSRMPTMTQLDEIAQIIGCDIRDVYHAFRADVDGAAAALAPELPDDEQALLAAYRRLADTDRPRVLRIIKAFNAE